LEIEKRKIVAPLDDYLGVSGLPFKMTRLAMLEVAFWGQNQCSYQRAEEILHKKCGIRLNDDTIRLVRQFDICRGLPQRGDSFFAIGQK